MSRWQAGSRLTLGLGLVLASVSAANSKRISHLLQVSLSLGSAAPYGAPDRFAEEMPIRQVGGDGDCREGVAELEYGRPGYTLLNGREEPVVNVLSDSPQALFVVSLI